MILDMCANLQLLNHSQYRSSFHIRWGWYLSPSEIHVCGPQIDNHINYSCPTYPFPVGLVKRFLKTHKLFYSSKFVVISPIFLMTHFCFYLLCVVWPLPFSHSTNIYLDPSIFCKLF